MDVIGYAPYTFNLCCRAQDRVTEDQANTFRTVISLLGSWACCSFDAILAWDQVIQQPRLTSRQQSNQKCCCQPHKLQQTSMHIWRLISLWEWVRTPSCLRSFTQLFQTSQLESLCCKVLPDGAQTFSMRGRVILPFALALSTFVFKLWMILWHSLSVRSSPPCVWIWMVCHWHTFHLFPIFAIFLDVWRCTESCLAFSHLHLHHWWSLWC